ncbi:MAG: YihY/virulence factor BrkB family protein [Deltaproteobacteria bacterium]|nr:MAG: YihY/virulence factor BrkB family protein [Deltaproteobacteria bacterium]
MLANVGRIVVITVKSAMNRDVSLLAAGLAFFALISMAPFLIIAVAVAGSIYGAEAANAELHARIVEELGPQVADLVTNLAAGARNLGSVSLATLVSVVVLFWGSTRLFAEVRRALHTLWDVPPRPPAGIRAALFGFVRGRLVAALGTLIFGAVFLALLGSRVALNIAKDAVGGLNWLDLPLPVWAVLENLVALLLVAGLVVVVYKLLPDRTPSGKPLWGGALLTAGLLLVGRFLVAAYVATGAIDSAYGAAGSLVVFLVWAYFSSLAFLLGARLTHLLETRAYRTEEGAAHASELAPLAKADLPVRDDAS